MLTDLEPMPFGKYKGKLMQDVPASYLHYLWQNGLKDEVDTSEVAQYIKHNLPHLKREYPDGIWS